MEDVTRKFTALDSKAEMREILSSVYNSLMVKGYNPINQIVGYILSEDPTLYHQLQQRTHADMPSRQRRAAAGVAEELSG